MKRNILKNYKFENDKQKIVVPKKIVKNAVIEDKKTIGLPGETIATKTDPVIIVNKDLNNVVTSIEVKCSCGETIYIDLDYDE